MLVQRLQCCFLLTLLHTIADSLPVRFAVVTGGGKVISHFAGGDHHAKGRDPPEKLMRMQQTLFGVSGDVQEMAETADVGVEIPSSIVEDGHLKGISIWGCHGDEECERLGFNARDVAMLWRDVNDLPNGRETPELRWSRGRAALKMVESAKGRIVAVDEDDGHLVASVCYDLESGHIHAVMTETARRRQRIASLLMASAIAHIRRRGESAPWLEVQGKSPHLVPLYTKMGFWVDTTATATIDDPLSTVMRFDYSVPSRLLDFIDLGEEESINDPENQGKDDDDDGSFISGLWGAIFGQKGGGDL